MNNNEIQTLKQEAENHLVNELLPFWTSRMIDKKNGVDKENNKKIRCNCKRLLKRYRPMRLKANVEKRNEVFTQNL